MARSALLPALGAAAAIAGTFGAASAFVAPAATVRGNLRASSAAPLLSEQSAASTLACGNGGLTALTAGSLLVAAAAASRSTVARNAEAKKKKKESFTAPEFIPRPEDLLESPKFPMFMGSAGGYMAKATRERHAITWTAKDALAFEMPTGTMGVMNKGENLCYFRKKEQCISLGKKLREMKIDNYKIYRLKKDGTCIFMHPADGVFPEKVNKGRVQVNGRPFSIGQGTDQATLRLTKYDNKPYEADPLTVLFTKARAVAFNDVENLFCQPADESTLVDKEYRAEYGMKSM